MTEPKKPRAQAKLRQLMARGGVRLNDEEQILVRAMGREELWDRVPGTPDLYELQPEAKP